MAKSRTSGKFKRARLRHALFTRGADKLFGGRLLERHLENEIEVHQHEVSIPNWPAELDGIRIGHLTDLHLGDLMPKDRAAAAATQSARADEVATVLLQCVTPDY